MAQRINNLEQAKTSLLYRFVYPEDECLHVLFLAKNGAIIDSHCTHGGKDHVHIDLRAIFWRAMENDAASVLLAHNHPSGIAEPSVSDREITRQFATAGKLLNVGVLDHVIYADGNWFSFRQSGLL